MYEKTPRMGCLCSGEEEKSGAKKKLDDVRRRQGTYPNNGASKERIPSGALSRDHLKEEKYVDDQIENPSRAVLRGGLMANRPQTGIICPPVNPG